MIYYGATARNGDQFSLIRFLELDRGTINIEGLVRRVQHYGQMHDYCSGGRPAWRNRYPVFPRLLIVLDGLSDARLWRRLRMLTDLASQDEDIVKHADTVGALVTTLGDLAEHGPFAPVFHPLVPHPDHRDQPLTLLLQAS